MLPVHRAARKQRTIQSNPCAPSPAVVTSNVAPSSAIPSSAVDRLASPPRNRLPAPTRGTASRLITPLKEERSPSFRTSQPLLDPQVDLIHFRFDCKASYVEPFQTSPFSENIRKHGSPTSDPIVRINAQYCHNCLCYVCGQPVENCKEWKNFHCSAHDKDSRWQSLKEIYAISEHPAGREPLATVVLDTRNTKKKQRTLKCLKAILRRNKQHVGGNKPALLDRIMDGETYGQLAGCPLCTSGRLKILETDTKIVDCQGYYEVDKYKVCNFRCLAGSAPRSAYWNSDNYGIHGNDVASKNAADTTSKRDRVQAYMSILRGNEKLKIPQLKRMLQKNRQHISGCKRSLLLRIADGRKYGRLGHCPCCKGGRLKVHQQDEDGIDTVSCPGFYDVCRHQTVPCIYSVPAKEAPRIGEWLE